MITLKILFQLLSHQERRKGYLILVLMTIMAILELFSLVSIMPFLTILAKPELIETDPILNEIYILAGRFGVKSPEDFLICLGLGAFFLILFSTAYRAFTTYYINSYIEMLRHSLGMRLLRSFLYRPYVYFLDQHSSEIAKHSI